jgi:hypothetical protein
MGRGELSAAVSDCRRRRDLQALSRQTNNGLTTISLAYSSSSQLAGTNCWLMYSHTPARGTGGVLGSSRRMDTRFKAMHFSRRCLRSGKNCGCACCGTEWFGREIHIISVLPLVFL